jgi:hypothetical protein
MKTLDQLEKELHWYNLIQKGMILSFFSEYRLTSNTDLMYEWICNNLDKNVFDSEYDYYYTNIAYSISKADKANFESKLHLIN